VRSLASDPAGWQEFRAATLWRARGLCAEMPNLRVAGKLLLAGMALGGVVAGHAVAYLAAIPSPAARHHVLAETGHGYWRVAVAAALGASLFAAGSVALRHVRAGAEGRARRADVCRWLAPRLAAVQVLVFLAAEATERVVAGVPLAEFLHEGLLLWGLVAQLLVALLATVVLGWLARAAVLVGRLLARPPRPARAVRQLPRPVVDVAVALAMIPGPITARGPPS
jgi:hypothetical protein